MPNLPRHSNFDQDAAETGERIARIMINTFLKRFLIFIVGVSLVFFSACAPGFLRKVVPSDQLLAYRLETGPTLAQRYAPVFMVENYLKPYNRIGTPSARITDSGKEMLYVDPDTATIYERTTEFKTVRGTYTNLIYRIHFEKIPSGVLPSHLGQGKNVGIFVIVTLNNLHQPVLYTSVQTCGCYLAFVPTSYTPADAFPEDWKTESQSVYSETLPGLLDFQGLSPEAAKTVIRIRAGSHRIKGFFLVQNESMLEYKTAPAELLPLDSLERISFENNGTTSFYETSGPRYGYVKGSHKRGKGFL